MMIVRFAEEGVSSRLRDRNRLKEFIKSKIQQYSDSTDADISYIFVDDESLYKMNVEYLQHDTYTDIITFDLSESEDKLIGELYISIDRIRDNAQINSVSYQQELHRVIFHGLLHLLGYNDKDAKKKKEMTAMEDKFLQEYFEDTIK